MNSAQPSSSHLAINILDEDQVSKITNLKQEPHPDYKAGNDGEQTVGLQSSGESSGSHVIINVVNDPQCYTSNKRMEPIDQVRNGNDSIEQTKEIQSHESDEVDSLEGAPQAWLQSGKRNIIPEGLSKQQPTLSQSCSAKNKRAPQVRLQSRKRRFIIEGLNKKQPTLSHSYSVKKNRAPQAPLQSREGRCIIEGQNKQRPAMSHSNSVKNRNGDGLKKLKIIEESSEEGVDLERYYPLCRAIDRSDWKAVEDFVNNDPEALKAKITRNSRTIFHEIFYSGVPVWLVKKLANKTGFSPKILEQQDKDGNTALTAACINGNTKSVEFLVGLNKNLLKLRDYDEDFPIHRAARFGHKETVKYLLSVTEEVYSDQEQSPFAGNNGVWLIECLIRSNLYGIALALLKRHPNIARESVDDQGLILEILSNKPLGFKSGRRIGYWQRFIYNFIPVKVEQVPFPAHHPENVNRDIENQTSKGCSRKSKPFGTLCQIMYIMYWDALKQIASSIKHMHDMKLMHMQTLEIVRIMFSGVIWSSEEAIDSVEIATYNATRLGICEIVDECIKAHQQLVFLEFNDGNSMYELAVLHRKEKVFHLITSKCYMFEVPDTKEGESILHLAGKLVPSSEIAGAALQMQRELQWFKAVENYVHPSFQEARNQDHKTPREVFTKEHEPLVEKGEKWMKDTAQSCTIVAALIITVVFAAAFTVPGGNDSAGMPIFLGDISFIVFAFSDALALFSSTTSLLMFLSILTARYSEEDFLVSLPRKLIIGLITLFLSMASMMVAFAAAFRIVLSSPWKWIIVPIALCGSVPVCLFALLQFPLLVEICRSTYRPISFQPQKCKDL